MTGEELKRIWRLWENISDISIIITETDKEGIMTILVSNNTDTDTYIDIETT